MPRPRIVSEIQLKISETAPPSVDSIGPHDWLSEESLPVFHRVLESGSTFEVYLSEAANCKIVSQAEESAPKRLEVMGFMLGEVCSWRGETYTIVWDIGTTSLKNTTAKVRFDHRALPRLFGELDRSGFDYVIVGWYHSHPGHTCFLSKTDLYTQKTMFDQPFHSALVVDPINADIKVFKLSNQGYREVPFALTCAARESGTVENRQRTRRLRTR